MAAYWKVDPGRPWYHQEHEVMIKKMNKAGMRISLQVYSLNFISRNMIAMRDEILKNPNFRTRPRDQILSLHPSFGSKIRKSSAVFISGALTHQTSSQINNSSASSHIVTSSLIIYLTFFSIQRFMKSDAITRCTMFRSRSKIVICYFRSVLYASLVRAVVIWRRFAQGFSTINIVNRQAGNEGEKKKKITLETLQHKCRSIGEHILFTTDAYEIESACFSLGVVLAWRAVYGMFFYVAHRLYSNSERK